MVDRSLTAALTVQRFLSLSLVQGCNFPRTAPFAAWQEVKCELRSQNFIDKQSKSAVRDSYIELSACVEGASTVKIQLGGRECPMAHLFTILCAIALV